MKIEDLVITEEDEDEDEEDENDSEEDLSQALELLENCYELITELRDPKHNGMISRYMKRQLFKTENEVFEFLDQYDLHPKEGEIIDVEGGAGE
jgi:hypothetical protein